MSEVYIVTYHIIDVIDILTSNVYSVINTRVVKFGLGHCVTLR